MATALCVFSRLWLWGEVSPQRSRALIKGLLSHVAAAARRGTQTLLLAVDGFATYPKAALQVFYTTRHTGRPGRPRHRPWNDLHMVQVVKRYRGKVLVGIERRVVHGCQSRVDDLIAMSQTAYGFINTAFIERLNATFRSRLPALARRTRNVARTTERLRAEMFWSGVVYNFCTVHESLEATPAMAAGLTDHVWSVAELLRFKPGHTPLHAIV